MLAPATPALAKMGEATRIRVRALRALRARHCERRAHSAQKGLGREANQRATSVTVYRSRTASAVTST